VLACILSWNEDIIRLKVYDHRSHERVG
jgi:hypothetical protein